MHIAFEKVQQTVFQNCKYKVAKRQNFVQSVHTGVTLGHLADDFQEVAAAFEEV
jgi:hypothetical protein